MKKSHLISLILTGAITIGAPITTINNNTVLATNKDNTIVSSSNLDVKNLKDGEYSLPISVKNFYSDATSMADGAIVKTAKLIVKNGIYSIQLTFKPLEKNLGSMTFKGYLGNLKYYNGDKTGGSHENASDNIVDSEFEETKIVENYLPSEIDDFFNTYKAKYPDRTAYPKVLEYKINKNKISNNKLNSYVQVFVPVMDSITPGLGTQKATVIYDFNNIKTIKLDKPAITESKFVELKVKDDTITTPKVRKNVDTIGKIIKEGNNEYLLLTYYSKVGEGESNDGIQNIMYSYSEQDPASSKISPDVKVVETLTVKEDKDTVYEISEAKIPITGKTQVIIHGNFQYPAGIRTQYGTITWSEKTNLVKENTKVDEPNLVVVKPVLRGVSVKKDGDEKRELDFSKNGISYSPYNGINGDKFKLADNYFFNIDIAFERTNLINTKTRHIKYTLDGSEPTFESKEATIRFANSDPYKPEFYYSLTVNPYDESSKVPTEGGNLVLKVKSFNTDGSESSKTNSYNLPFDKETLDNISTKSSIDGKEYDTILSSNKKFLLDDNTTIKISNISEKILNQTLDSKINELGLTDFKTFKLEVTKKDGSNFTPIDKDGWSIDSNPIFKLKLVDFPADDNTHAYIYENGNLRLVPSNNLKDGFEFNINSSEAYFVIAKKDTKTLTEEKINELKTKVEAVKKIISDSASVSTAKSNLEAELTKIEKTLGRKKIQLNNLLLHLEILNKNLIELKSNSIIDISYLQKNASTLTYIVDSNVLSELLTDSKLTKLKELKNKINNSLNNPAELEQNLKDLQNELNNLEYKYPTQDIDFTIKKYYNPTETSMANNVFVNKAKLIFTPDKTYLDIDLKTMIFGSLRAHLLDLDIFKDKLDGEKLSYHVINKYDDLNSLTGELSNFNKKLLVELEKDIKNSYDVRVPNDGMGGAKPEAKLVISTIIKKPEAPELDTEGLNSEITAYEKIEVNNKDTDAIKEEFNKLTKIYNEAKQTLKDAKKQEEINKVTKKLNEAIQKFNEVRNKQENPGNETNDSKDNNNQGINPNYNKNDNNSIIKLEKTIDNFKVSVEFKKGIIDANYLHVSIVETDAKTIEEKIRQNLQKINSQVKNIEVKVLEIHLEKDGKEVKGVGNHLVKIAVADTNKKDYLIYHVKEKGELELIDSKVIGDELQFNVNHFSKFAIVSKDKKQDSSTSTINNNKLSNTGNISNISYQVFGAVLLILCILFGLRKKTK